MSPRALLARFYGNVLAGAGDDPEKGIQYALHLAQETWTTRFGIRCRGFRSSSVQDRSWYCRHPSCPACWHFRTRRQLTRLCDEDTSGKYYSIRSTDTVVVATAVVDTAQIRALGCTSRHFSKVVSWPHFLFQEDPETGRSRLSCRYSVLVAYNTFRPGRVQYGSGPDLAEDWLLGTDLDMLHCTDYFGAEPGPDDRSVVDNLTELNRRHPKMYRVHR